MNNRNDFPARTKQMLCLSVSGHCSICGTCTTWVDDNTTKKENIGEAAHIEAAAEGGPRYNPYQTEEQRASFDNGIWLCSNCHTKIDSNPDCYTVELLRAYKTKAMNIAKSNLSESLKGEGKVKVQDFTPSMLSFFSMLYGIQESLHNSIKIVKKYADNLFREYETENMFYTQYAFESSLGSHTLFPNLSIIKTDLWTNKIPPLMDKIKEGRLYIPDKSYNDEQRYLEVIGCCPILDEDWWLFFGRIVNKFDELDEINTRLLAEYKSQYSLFREDY